MSCFKPSDADHSHTAGRVDGSRNITDLDVDGQLIHRNERNSCTIVADDEELRLQSGMGRHLEDCSMLGLVSLYSMVHTRCLVVLLGSRRERGRKRVRSVGNMKGEKYREPRERRKERDVTVRIRDRQKRTEPCE